MQAYLVRPRLRKLASVALAAVLTMLGLASGGSTQASAHTAAAAAAGLPPESVIALYHGRTLRMAENWEGAQSCVVYSRVRVECFDSNAEADAALAASGSSELESDDVGALAAIACARGWLCLYAGVNGTGRRLIFQDDYWQSLYPYGFDGETSSWRNNQASDDQSYLDDTPDHDRYLVLSPRAQATRMGQYNDWANWVNA